MNNELTITIWQATVILLSVGLVALFSGAVIVLASVYMAHNNPSLSLAIQKLSESYPANLKEKEETRKDGSPN